MADIAVVSTELGLPFPKEARVRSYKAAEALTKGQSVYRSTTGTVGISDGNITAKDEFLGIALQSAGQAGQTIDVLEMGECEGFTVTGMNVGDKVFLSDTAGALADGPGTRFEIVGEIVNLNDGPNQTKVIRFYDRSEGLDNTVLDGGAVTQASSITTGVELNTMSGQITTVTGPSIAAGAEATFTVTNSKVVATDVVSVAVQDQFTDGLVAAVVSDVSAGTFNVTITNLHASTAVSAGAAKINFVVLKAANS